MGFEHVEGGGGGGWLAVHYHGDAVADQHGVDAGLLEDGGGADVVASEHGDAPPGLLGSLEIGNGEHTVSRSQKGAVRPLRAKQAGKTQFRTPVPATQGRVLSGDLHKHGRLMNPLQLTSIAAAT